MLFTSSFQLLGAVAFMLPALLVSARPHTVLSEREISVMFHQCDTDSSSDCEYTLEAVEITLDWVEDNIFDVVGGWEGTTATAQSTQSFEDELNTWLTNNYDGILAYGHDNEEPKTYYAIFKNEQGSDSGGSEDTIRG